MILAWGKPTGGTHLTLRVCRCRKKPHLVIDLADEERLVACLAAARAWIAGNLPGGVLNVAGPRASKSADVYDRARVFLRALLGGREG